MYLDTRISKPWKLEALIKFLLFGGSNCFMYGHSRMEPKIYNSLVLDYKGLLKSGLLIHFHLFKVLDDDFNQGSLGNYLFVITRVRLRTFDRSI
jgi:hypothetical protein